jgi:hypothetical protein
LYFVWARIFFKSSFSNVPISVSACLDLFWPISMV